MRPAPFYYDTILTMSHWTLTQRIMFAAMELRNLRELLEYSDGGSIRGKAWSQIQLGNYQSAIDMLKELE